MEVIITGGSGGVGSALCDVLEARGHRPIVIDKSEPDHGRAWVKCDFAHFDSVESCIEQAFRFGLPQALVNLAGIYRVRTLEEFSWSECDEYLDVNLRGPIAAALAWERLSRELHDRCLVNVSSAGALRGSRDLAYAISKSALIGATRSLARSMRATDVTVVAVTPGLIDSPMSSKMSAERRRDTVSSTIANRPGTTTELAEFLFHLLEHPSTYLTGAVLPFDGGLT